MGASVSCGPKVSVIRTAPAKYKVAGSYSLGILPFTSSTSAGIAGAERVTDSLYESLRIKRFYSDIRPLAYPKGMDRRKISALTSTELSRILSGTGVDIAVKGNVFKYGVENDHSKKQVEKEVGTGKYINEPYYEDGQRKIRRVEIMQIIVEDVPTLHKIAEVGFEIDLLNLNQKRWTDHDRFYKKKEYSAEGSADIEKLPRDSLILSGFISDIIKDAVDRFVPHPVAEDRTLSSCRGCKEGVALAKKGKWAGAVASWSAIIANEPQDHAAYYNIGIAKEAMKDYSSALDNYQTAVQITDKSRYLKAADRMKKIIEDEKILVEQMRGKK